MIITQEIWQPDHQARSTANSCSRMARILVLFDRMLNFSLLCRHQEQALPRPFASPHWPHGYLTRPTCRTRPRRGIRRGEKISPLPQAVYGCARRRAEDDAARSWQGFRLSEGQIRAILSAPLLLFWSINRWRPPLVPFSPAAAGGLTS